MGTELKMFFICLITQQKRYQLINKCGDNVITNTDTTFFFKRETMSSGSSFQLFLRRSKIVIGPPVCPFDQNNR